MSKFTKFIGMDVHRDTISVSVADARGGTPRFVGEIASTQEALARLVKQLDSKRTQLSFCYEAGPCGYAIHRTLTGWGHACAVVAPSLCQRQLKTDPLVVGNGKVKLTHPG